MRNPTNVKEVHQLTGHLASMSRFLSCVGDNAFFLFSALKKKERFEWNTECDEAFSKVKASIVSPLIPAP